MVYKTNTSKEIEKSINDIDENASTSISVRDLMYVYKTMEELNNFFHQPMNYQDFKDLENFLGNKDAGACHEISKCYYEILWNNLPENIKMKIEES